MDEIFAKSSRSAIDPKPAARRETSSGVSRRGSANRVTQTWGSAWNNSGDTVTASILGNREVKFQDQVNLWIEAGEERLRMPPAMLPGLLGGENGWFELREIKVSDGEITAKVAVNFLNKPNLRLDRYSGAISISGKAGDYSGQCQVYNPDAAAAKLKAMTLE